MLIHWQGHRITAKAFLADEALGGVDQLFQILHPVRAFAFGLVMLDQPAVLHHQVDDVAQREAGGLLAQHIEPGNEGANVGAGLARHHAHGIMQ